MKYRTIVADPPWSYPRGSSKVITGKRDGRAAGKDFYPTMTCQEIAGLKIPAKEDSHLYLWTTNNHMIEAHWVAEEWGFRVRTILTWDKTGPLGLGLWFRSRTEHVIFATRGSLPISAEKRKQNIFHAPNGRHSEKPAAFFDLVEQVSPGPYLEMFARQQRLGWDTWGNEALNHVELSA